MLSRYFLKTIIFSFMSALVALVLVFSCGDAILRLSYVPSLRFLPQLMLAMLPPILLFVLPLALSFAASTIVSQLQHRQELLLVQYLPSARGRLYLTVMLGSLLASLFYVPLIMYWAPHSYWQSKQLIMRFAYHELDSLTPGQFHRPFSSAMFFFEKKLPGPVFKNIIIRYIKQGHPIIITAQSGSILHDTLHLLHGVMQYNLNDQEIIAHFKCSKLLLSQLLGTKPDSLKASQARYSQMKYLTYKELQQIGGESNKAWVALHCRYTRIIWLFILPLCTLWGMLSFGVLNSPNTVLSLMLNGFLFLFSYINISFACAFWKHPHVALLLLYGSLILLTLFMYLNYRSKFFGR